MALASEVNIISGTHPLFAESVEVSVERMESNTPDRGPFWIVRLKGAVDWTTSTQLQARFEQLLKSLHPERLIMDLSGAGHVDSSGIGVLMKCVRDATREHVPFLLTGLSGSVLRMLRRTQLHTLLDIRPTIQDAMRG